MTSYVSYLRVSTAQQGASGLGLDAQRQAVQSYVAAHGGRLILPDFVEVESGRNGDRPQLAAALARCKQTGATLIVAKLDRLSRSVAFISTLMEAGVPFIACDQPHANELTIHILAAVAQAEAKAISARTSAALKAASARGVKLGARRNPHVVAHLRPGAGAQEGAAASKAAALARAWRVWPDVRERLDAGLSLNATARSLNEAGIKTQLGNAWTATGVRKIRALIGE